MDRLEDFAPEPSAGQRTLLAVVAIHGYNLTMVISPYFTYIKLGHNPYSHGISWLYTQLLSGMHTEVLLHTAFFIDARVRYF